MVFCCVNVGVIGMCATNAAKFLKTPILLINPPAFRTLTARVSRQDRHHQHSSKYRFVLDEAPQLAETPRTHPRSISLAKPNAPADTAQVFQRNSANAVFGLTDEILRYTMINVSTKEPLFPRQSAKLTPYVFGALVSLRGFRFLQTSALLAVNTAQSIDFTGFNDLPIARGGQIYYSEVNTKELPRRRSDWLFHLNRTH